MGLARRRNAPSSPETLIVPERHTSVSQETPFRAKILPSGNKKAIKPDNQPDSADYWFPGHDACPPCGLSFLFSTNNSFLTFDARVHL
jgi:hypothetical protein